MREDRFSTVRSEGALLPSDLLLRVVEADRTLGGLAEMDYGLVEGEKVGEAIARSWNRMLGLWRGFSEARAKLPAYDLGVTETRRRWLLPLFEELHFGGLPQAPAREAHGRTFAVYASWNGRVPLHLVGCGVDLDKRTPGVAGAARTSPYGLTQEYLNAFDDSLWGIVSNGLRLRLLRDNVRMTRPAFVEFDLEAMMDGEVYADFALLWLLCHRSRFDGARPADCWLERWSQSAAAEGTRVLDRLRVGVKLAIERLGAGFLAHPANVPLRDALRDGRLTGPDYYHEVLRLVYRLIFLFVAEDRDLLLAGDDAAARKRYAEHYSTARLRRIASRWRGTPHGDLWRGLQVVMRCLDGDGAGTPLALPALGGALWSADALPHLGQSALANSALLDAVRALALNADDGARRPVDFRNLGSEEIGSVYESLLELHPKIDVPNGAFELDVAGGSDRKTTGSYYTPSSLIECLLDSALEPVLADRLARVPREYPDEAQAILSLRVVDPACGSGHFLVAAAHRLAKRLAQVRTGDAEPSPISLQTALRDVIGRCLYGVDLNPMAVELCKVSLWLEALEPGRPLSFLDHHVQCGNSLLGATPELLANGLPDEAFEALEGDDKKLAAAFKRRNKEERGRTEQGTFDFGGGERDALGSLAEKAGTVEAADDRDVAGVARKAGAWAGLVGSTEFQAEKRLADAWCAAFVWLKRNDAPPIVTTDTLRRLRRDPNGANLLQVAEIDRLAAEYRFLHWHLAFPQVHQRGGFDVVLGNPPWERVKLQEQEFFAARDPEVANAANAAARKTLIAALPRTNPVLHAEYVGALRRAEGTSHILRQGGRYPLCGRGDVNTYAVFAELKRTLINPRGRVGCIVPSGIATDDTTKLFFRDLFDRSVLRSLYDFENRLGIFPAVDSRVKFCLMTLGAPLVGERSEAEFVFFAHQMDDLADPDRRFSLSAEDIALLNPNTRTCPIFRTRRDAEITKAIYRRVPVLIDEARGDDGNPWGLRFLAMFHMANDSGLFHTMKTLETEGFVLDGNVFVRGEERMLPLYEAKMVHQFDHRFGDYRDRPEDAAGNQLPEVPLDRLHDPAYVPLPRYWVPAAEVESRLAGRWDRGWLLGWRRICRSTDERTVISSVIPYSAVGDNYFLALPDETEEIAGLSACLSSFVVDFAARQKAGGINMNFYVFRQLPIFPPAAYGLTASWDRRLLVGAWIRDRVLELSCTAADLTSFGRSLGHLGNPFEWNDARRILLRCELDAAFFHLYGVSRADAAYILDTFSVVRENDEKTHGEYRTKRVILEIYDALQHAIDSGIPYATPLDPPPADPRCAHMRRTQA